MVGELHGKVALVTGGATGIGRAVAVRLAEAGAAIVLHYHASKDDAEVVSRLVRDLGMRCVPLQADLSDRSTVFDLAERAESAFGRVDILVNNAAVADATVERGEETDLVTSLAQWDRVMDTNLWAPVALAARLAPRMTSGSVVNVASVSGMYALTDAWLYSLSKAALLHATRQLALRLAPNVRVNAVAPGWVDTAFHGGFIQDPEFQRRLSRAVPLGRLAEPEEVAEAVHFLVSRASYATGTVLTLDGGLVAELR